MIFCWNVRGLNGHNKRRDVSRWIATSDYLIGGILESRVREPNFMEVLSSTLPGWNYEGNYSETAVNGRIVVVWKSSLSVITFYKSDQLVLCGVYNPATNKYFSIAFVYARNTEVERQSLWESLELIAAMRVMNSSPWIVLGDFNQVLSTTELFSVNPYPPSLQGIRDLLTCLDSCMLMDLAYRGSFHTWSNRQPLDPIARKLDRALCNELWLDTFPQSFAEFGVPGPSDHSPCSISLSQYPEKRKCPFKYFTFFFSHPDFRSLLQEAWEDVEDIGSGLVVLYKRLRAAKFCCQSLNHNKFNNIQQRASEALQLMEALQSSLLLNPSQALFEQEKQARDRWLFWSVTEQTFYRQKSRIRWLGEGDANSTFFFKSIKANLTKNIIHYLRDSDGIKVSDTDGLKALVTQFYSDLLGRSNGDVTPLSV